MKFRHIIGGAIAAIVLTVIGVVFMFVNKIYTGKWWPQ
jgi:hypothetical protein